jgi:catechol 2,3-dioxygenase-like lactoylglutathione lyase family enzyme
LFTEHQGVENMKIQRIDHVGINVNDPAAAKAFFLDFGSEVQWEGEMSGELLETVV